MKIRIKLIPLAVAKQGMKLGTSVHDNEGRVLLTAGTELSANSLVSLQRRSVSFVPIQEEDVRSEEELAVERKKTTERINALFHSAPANANLESLRQLILEYRLEPLS